MNKAEETLRRTSRPDTTRATVREWLTFVQHWAQFDASSLFRRVETDELFADAVCAVINTGETCYDSIEALRNFCVQQLSGSTSIQSSNQNVGWLTPFSLPISMVVQIMRSALDTGRNAPREVSLTHLHTFRWLFPVGVKNGVSTKRVEMLGQTRLHLVTTAWAKCFPAAAGYDATLVRLLSQSTQRYLNVPLQAATMHPQPLLQLYVPNESLEVTLDRQRHDQLYKGSPKLPDYTVFLFLEGWYYDVLV